MYWNTPLSDISPRRLRASEFMSDAEFALVRLLLAAYSWVVLFVWAALFHSPRSVEFLFFRLTNLHWMLIALYFVLMPIEFATYKGDFAEWTLFRRVLWYLGDALPPVATVVTVGFYVGFARDGGDFEWSNIVVHAINLPPVIADWYLGRHIYTLRSFVPVTVAALLWMGLWLLLEAWAGITVYKQVPITEVTTTALAGVGLVAVLFGSSLLFAALKNQAEGAMEGPSVRRSKGAVDNRRVRRFLQHWVGVLGVVFMLATFAAVGPSQHVSYAQQWRARGAYVTWLNTPGAARARALLDRDAAVAKRLRLKHVALGGPLCPPALDGLRARIARGDVIRVDLEDLGCTVAANVTALWQVGRPQSLVSTLGVPAAGAELCLPRGSRAFEAVVRRFPAPLPQQ